ARPGSMMISISASLDSDHGGRTITPSAREVGLKKARQPKRCAWLIYLTVPLIGVMLSACDADDASDKGGLNITSSNAKYQYNDASSGADAGSSLGESNAGSQGAMDNSLIGSDDPSAPADTGATQSVDASADAGAEPDALTCNKSDKVVMYLSADDSNSMAGATVARGLT
ncbi:MAG TPA: hypothetical protein DCQ06_01855, partial [Myxococcales bacterium]|nr:hypothetical protein [Myxococcales bacterium]